MRLQISITPNLTMTRYIIRRLLFLPVILFGVTILIFGILQLLDPAERAALYVKDVPKNPNAVRLVIAKYGLDKPIICNMRTGLAK